MIKAKPGQQQPARPLKCVCGKVFNSRRRVVDHIHQCEQAQASVKKFVDEQPPQSPAQLAKATRQFILRHAVHETLRRR